MFYSVTLIRQFENVSIVQFNIDKAYCENELSKDIEEHTIFELSIRGYECRADEGGGSDGHESHTYVVSPALPDDISKVTLVFKEYKAPFKKPTGFEISI